MNIQALIVQIKLLFAQLALKVSTENAPTLQGDSIYHYALTQLGIDASPNDLAPDELGCAETVSTILNHLFKDVTICVGTSVLFSFFKQSDKFVEVMNPLHGDIIISPTGFGGLNGISNGHTGIVGIGSIMSNSSATGTFEQNYTLATWNARYKNRGGYPVLFFRRIAG